MLPVYCTDKQRAGRGKQFVDLTDEELRDYHQTMARGVQAALEAEGPEIVHANHLVWQPVVAAEVCGALDIPFYIVAHGSSLERAVRRDKRFKQAAEMAILRAAGLLWIAPNTKDRVLELYPAHRDLIESRSHFVGIGADTSLFQPVERSRRTSCFARLSEGQTFGGKSTEQKRELKARLNRGDLEAVRDYWNAYDHRLPDEDLAEQLNSIPEDADLLLYVGALIWGKGVQALPAAMPEILLHRPNVHLLIVGSGTFRETLEGLVYSLETRNEGLFDELVSKGRGLDRDAAPGPLDELRDYACDADRRRLLFGQGLGLAGKVHFLGRLDHSRLRWVFPCCQLAVFPSIISEASPLVLAESMANGVLPLGAYHSGLKDGLDALADDLPKQVWERLKVDPNLAARVGSVAENVSWLLTEGVSDVLRLKLRQIAEERYDWNFIAAALAQSAEKMIGST